MMAKKLQRSVKGVDAKTTFPIGKTVATTGGKTKKIAKVKGKPVAAKQPNKLVGKRTVKGY